MNHAKNLHSHAFIEFATKHNVLKFGEFRTKAGRLSPYFFNAGEFNNGAILWQLANFYAQHIMQQGIIFDVLFGPAYKGITLASATACALSQLTHTSIPFCFNRKEIKQHGEGGQLVGADLSRKKILIIDDVISAGTSIKESIDMIQASNGIPCGVVIALDRMEKSGTDIDIGKLSAIQCIEKDFYLPVSAIANLNDLLAFVQNKMEFQNYAQAIQSYKIRYGIT
jgi:orotate phosphoribosyltransferase